MFIDSLHDLFAQIVAELIGGDDDALYSYRIDVFILSGIGALRNGHLGVIRIFLHELVNNLRVDVDDGSGFIGSQVLDSGGREACYYYACIYVAVLQCIGSFAEGEVLYVNIIVGNAIGFQNLAGIGFGAGAGCTDSHLLALQVRYGLDTLILGGYELDGFRIQGSQTADIIHLVVFEHFLAVSCIVGDIVLNESNIYGTVLQHIYVGYRCAGGLGRCVHALNVLVQKFSQSAAQGIIGACRAAGGDIQELLAACRAGSGAGAAAAACKKSCTSQTKCTCYHQFFQCLLHHTVLLKYPQMESPVLLEIPSVLSQSHKG